MSALLFRPAGRSLLFVPMLMALVIAAAALPWAVPASAAPPTSVVDAAVDDLAERADVDAGDIELIRAAAVTWPDGCLGAAEPDEACIQVLTDGWVLWLATDEDAYRYHTDLTQHVRFVAGPIGIDEVDDADLPDDAMPREISFTGELPGAGGVALVTWNGGHIEELVDGAPGAISFWVTSGGALVGYIPGAPAFVNESFVALFVDEQVAAGTHMIVVLPRAADFNETGNVVIGTPGLPAGVWHLVYEAPGAPALTVRLEFDAQSECLLPAGEAFLCDEIEVGTRAQVTGRLVAEDLVSVSRVQVVETVALALEVFFLDEEQFAVGEPPFVVGVPREVSAPPAASGLLEALFTGPTSEEAEDGLVLIASEATGAQVMEIADGIARVQLLGGCNSMGATFTIANQIIPTLTQLDAIDWVKIYDPEGTTGEPTGETNSIPGCLEP